MHNTTSFLWWSRGKAMQMLLNKYLKGIWDRPNVGSTNQQLDHYIGIEMHVTRIEKNYFKIHIQMDFIKLYL